MDIERLYLEYKNEVEKALKLGRQMSKYYINELKPKGIVSYDVNQLPSEYDEYKQMRKERSESISKYNLLAKDIADELDGKIFKLSNGNYIAFDDNPENGEYIIREYEVYE